MSDIKLPTDDEIWIIAVKNRIIHETLKTNYGEGAIWMRDTYAKPLLEENAKLRAQLKIAEYYLGKYSRAKILFASYNGEMPEPRSKELGLFESGFEPTEMHVKDDGKWARQALEKIQALEDAEVSE